MAQPPGKGLPGFLRRSVRSSYSEHDDAVVKTSPDRMSESEQRASMIASMDEDVDEVGCADGEAAKNVNRKFRLSLSTSSNSIHSSPNRRAALRRPSEDLNGLNTERVEPAAQSRSYREVTFENMITAPVVDMRDLRRLAWNGIPAQHRPQSWQILLGYLPANASRRRQTLDRKRAEYRDAIAQHYDIDDNTRTNQEQETLRQVLVDVPRTAPDVALFRNDRIRHALARLLYIWAIRHPASSYVQGINDLATPFIAVFLTSYDPVQGRDVLNGEIMDHLSDESLAEVEADVYWCLTNLLAGIQDHYTSDQPGVQRMIMKLEELIHRIDVELTEHFRTIGMEFLQFAFKWMNCLLLREFQLRSILRLWDTYLSEGDSGFESFHVYVCAAFLCQFSTMVRTMEFDELFGFMQNIPTSDWGDGELEILLSQAFVLSTLFQGSDAHLTSHRS